MPKPQLPTKVSVDFSNVGERTEGGKAARVPEGDYLLEVVGAELRRKKDDETSKYLSWKLHPIKPEKYKTAGIIYFVTSLKEEALWNLRNFLEDLGLKVPKKMVDVPVKTIVEKKMVIGATLADDEYNGKVKSVVAATFNKKDYEETDVATSTDEEEEEEEESSDDEEEEELDELEVDDL